jgi:hypothetical protein
MADAEGNAPLIWSCMQSKCGLIRVLDIDESPTCEDAEDMRPTPIVRVTITVAALGPEQARKFEHDFEAWLRTHDARPTPAARVSIKPGDPVPPCACGTVEAWHNPGCSLYPEGGYPADQPWRGPPKEAPINVVPLAGRLYREAHARAMTQLAQDGWCRKCGWDSKDPRCPTQHPASCDGIV